VAHNLSFDVHQVREAIGFDMLDEAGRLADTDILARVALPERAWMAGDEGGYKLKNLATTYLRADAKDAEARIEELAKSIGLKTLKATGSYYEVWRAYPEAMEAYALLDAEYARDLYPLLQTKLNEKMAQCWRLEREVAPTIIRSEQRGVRVDPVVVKQLREEYEPLEAAAAEVVAQDLPDVNLASPVQLRDALVEMGVPLYRKTQTGELSTAAFALAEFEDQFPVLKALGEWRQANKMLGTYIGPMSGREIVHTSFWQIGAKTGRMSCSRPNMQNLPARAEAGDTKLREVFIPREGYCFLVCDFDSIEVRGLAHYLNSPEYTQLIEEGLDPHAWMAAQVYGGVPEDYAKDGPNAHIRTECKNVLFAIVYGAGANRVSDMLRISKDEARDLIGRIKRALPRYFDLKARVDRKIRGTGYVTTIGGRKACVARDKSYVGVNALIQGSAADLFKGAILAVDHVLPNYDAHMVLYVHDEIVVECPTHNAEACLADVIAAMETSYDLKPSLKVTGSIAYKNYAEAK
jgi:DNA polymerase-1